VVIVAGFAGQSIASPLADDVDPVNVFASEDKRKTLSVKEAAKRFLGMYGQKGDK